MCKIFQKKWNMYGLQIILSFYECLKLKSSIQEKINNGLLNSLLFAKRRELIFRIKKIILNYFFKLMCHFYSEYFIY